MISDRAIIFHMCIPCSKTFSLVQRSYVKVKYQDNIFQKITVTGALVFHKHHLLPDVLEKSSQ